MKTLFAHITRKAMTVLYRLFCATTQRSDMVVFLSRQTDKPSSDFTHIASECEEAGWTVRMHVMKATARRALPYALHVLREIKLLAQCRMAVIDRYDPVVCLLDFDTVQQATLQKASQGTTDAPVHTVFPTQPVVVQIWHAFGAFKQFGFQSVDVPEGHPRTTLETFKIHRNYTWVMCSSESCRHAYAQAFSCPVERVIPYLRPAYFELVEQGKVPKSANDNDSTPAVLMAPTRRMSAQSAHPFRSLHESTSTWEQALSDVGVHARLSWAFHPLDEGAAAPGSSNDALHEADLVVTDYSSIVYDAFLLHTPVLFYIPDIEAYRQSPGLNSDPEVICPTLCARTPAELAERVSWALANRTQVLDALGPFARLAFDTREAQRVTLVEAIGITRQG